MTKSTTILLPLAACSLLFAGSQVAGAASNVNTTTKTVRVVMHDPGCHWFSVGGKFTTKLSVKGPIALANFDEAAIKVAGPNGIKRDAVGPAHHPDSRFVPHHDGRSGEGRQHAEAHRSLSIPDRRLRAGGSAQAGLLCFETDGHPEQAVRDTLDAVADRLAAQLQLVFPAYGAPLCPGTALALGRDERCSSSATLSSGRNRDATRSPFRAAPGRPVA